jgi:hypothetical protein
MNQLTNKTIHSESELRDMLKIYAPGNESQARKTLIDGFEIVRTRIETESKINEIDPDKFGGYVPAPFKINASVVTLDRFIERSMGGQRDGLTIRWTIGDTTWAFDPWTGALNGKRCS